MSDDSEYYMTSEPMPQIGYICKDEVEETFGELELDTEYLRIIVRESIDDFDAEFEPETMILDLAGVRDLRPIAALTLENEVLFIYDKQRFKILVVISEIKPPLFEPIESLANAIELAFATGWRVVPFKKFPVC